MDSAQFRKCAKEMVDYVTDYQENVRKRPVLPDVEPGYLRKLLPDSAPMKPEKWSDVLQDVERIILPGMTHWNSPQFHAYYPVGSSYPSMLADILINTFTCIGFTWMTSPACTELEMVMMDWLGKALQLPKQFLFETGGLGGGVIQGSASESTFVALLAARNQALTLNKDATLDKLVAYTSDQSHSSVERAALLGAVKIRLLPTDGCLSLRGKTVAKAIQEDRQKGLVPFMVVCTLGTTNTCAFDNIKEVGKVCKSENLWLHIDAAYAGSAFICPEYRYLLDGVEYANSYDFNPHKWMLVNYECSAMWVKNRDEFIKAFSVDPAILKHVRKGEIPDYRHWQIPFGRRFRSLKLWFVFRLYGMEGLRKHIRDQIQLAKEFESLISSHCHFEVIGPAMMGLVCFRLKGSNSVNESLYKMVNERRKIHITMTKVRGQVLLRFVVCSRFTTSDDIIYAFKEIQHVAALLMKNLFNMLTKDLIF